MFLNILCRELQQVIVFYFFKATAKFPPERFPQAEEKGPGGMQQQQQQTGPKKVVLNSSDELFYDIRDLNFSAVGIHLSRRAKQISAAFEVSVSELKIILHVRLCTF